MADGLFSWNAENYTPEENSRWVWLRSVEWDSYPNFLAPLWGISIVYFYGWIAFLLTLIVATFIWRLFIMKSFLSIALMSAMSIIINFVKWPLAVIFAAISYFTHHSILFSASLLLFPVITYFCSFLEMPYSLGGITKQGKRAGDLQARIFDKLGLKESYAEPTADKNKHSFLKSQ